MSVQAQLLAQIQELVMKILKNGTVTEEEGLSINSLEDELFKQNSFKASTTKQGSLQGEEIATLFFNNSIDEGTEMLKTYEITPPDFFGFIDYHYDEEHPDEAHIGMFTQSFITELDEKYKLV